MKNVFLNFYPRYLKMIKTNEIYEVDQYFYKCDYNRHKLKPVQAVERPSTQTFIDRSRKDSIFSLECRFFGSGFTGYQHIAPLGNYEEVEFIRVVLLDPIDLFVNTNCQ